ncbi:hypothetical protein D8M06_13995 [Oceanobacillus halophilus]|uniref:Uncharacterized protein n=1 Tax=Oceanobacillus halophilus TaxID=930130 RepID=A0A495A131_9BACI|nr:hypothetical protein D8M06_13995 [Oceanobacillus halophilus]
MIFFTEKFLLQSKMKSYFSKAFSSQSYEAIYKSKPNTPTKQVTFQLQVNLVCNKSGVFNMLSILFCRNLIPNYEFASKRVDTNVNLSL